MKISQISVRRVPWRDDLPSLQAMVLEELLRRPDEVFRHNDEALLGAFPKLKPSALSWSLWGLHQKKLIGKMRVRLEGRMATVFGSAKAIKGLAQHLENGSRSSVDTMVSP